MKKEFKVDGMMCNHCRMHVEKALNALEGVRAAVTLEPPVAEVEFTGDRIYTLAELQKQVNRLRRRGIPIASDRSGYFYAQTAGEAYATIRQLRKMANGLEAAIQGMEQSLDDFPVGR